MIEGGVYERIHMRIKQFLLLLSLLITPLLALEKQTVIMVYSMPRSGSSLVTKGLEALGAELGKRSIKPNKNNPTGFFEDQDLRRYNETVAYLVGISRNSVANYPSAIPNAEILVDYGEAFIRKKLGNHPLIALKDPKSARNAQIWERITEQMDDICFKSVIIVRNPEAAADSCNKLFETNLRKEDRFSYMWLHHYIAALQHTNGEDRCIVSYERLIDDPASELVRIANHLNLPLTQENFGAIDQFAYSFVDQKLNRCNNQDSPSHPDVKKLYSLLLDAASSSHSNPNDQELELTCCSIQEKLNRLESLFINMELKNRQAMHKRRVPLLPALVYKYEL